MRLDECLAVVSPSRGSCALLDGNSLSYWCCRVHNSRLSVNKCHGGWWSQPARSVLKRLIFNSVFLPIRSEFHKRSNAHLIALWGQWQVLTCPDPGNSKLVAPPENSSTKLSSSVTLQRCHRKRTLIAPWLMFFWWRTKSHQASNVYPTKIYSDLFPFWQNVATHTTAAQR